MIYVVAALSREILFSYHFIFNYHPFRLLVFLSDQRFPQGGPGSSYAAKPENSSNGTEHVVNGIDHLQTNANGKDHFQANSNGMDYSSNGTSNGNVAVQHHR